MATTISTGETLPIVIPYLPWRMSVAKYHQLIRSGEIEETHRIELLRGVMVQKMTHNPLHAVLIGVIQSLLNSILPMGFHTRSQVPITLADSEPEPDVTIARGKLLDYLRRHPGPLDAPLVIEIASTTLVTDQYKGEIYAEAGIPCYWIINLIDRRIEVYSRPMSSTTGSRYADCRHFVTGESVPVILDQTEFGKIQAIELLPDVS